MWRGVVYVTGRAGSGQGMSERDSRVGRGVVKRGVAGRGVRGRIGKSRAGRGVAQKRESTATRRGAGWKETGVPWRDVAGQARAEEGRAMRAR